MLSRPARGQPGGSGEGTTAACSAHPSPCKCLPLLLSPAVKTSLAAHTPPESALLGGNGVWWRKWSCSSGGVNELLRGVLLISAPHPRCLPTLPSDLPAAPDHVQALAGDPPQTSLVLFSPFIPLHPSSARVLGTLGHSVALR